MLAGILPERLQATFWPGGRLPSDGHVAFWGTEDPAEGVAAVGLPRGEPAVLPTVLPASAQARKRVVAADVAARVVPVRSAVRALAALPGDWPGWQRPGDSVIGWSVAAKLALEYVAAGHLVPMLRSAGPGEGIALWRLANVDDGRLARLAGALPAAAHALRRDEDDETVWTASDLLAAFCDAVADSCARTAGPGASAKSARVAQQAKVRGSDWRHDWLNALTGDDPVVRLPDDSLVDDLAKWAAPLVRSDGDAGAQLCVQLHTPPQSADESTEPRWPLTYHLQATDDPSLMIAAEQVWQSGAAGMTLFERRSGDAQESLVKGLAEAARLFPPIDASLGERRPTGLELSTDQAAAFLAHGATALAAGGLGVLLPAELTAKGARRLRARLRVGEPVVDPGAGITDAGLGADHLKQFRWEAAIGDERLSDAEFADIVELKQSLVLWKGRWVRLDADDLPKLAAVVGRTGELSGVEALSVALAGKHETADLGTVDVIAEGPLRELVDKLHNLDRAQEPYLNGIDATLRDYQRRGVAWLQSMSGLGLGALLADDMGLGKTLQTISLLAGRPAGPHLVVCPTSLVGNWERELARFAPYLPVIRHHGPERPAAVDDFKSGSVVITSYGLLRRDAGLLTAVKWDVVVLDEAQQIKNQAAQTARTARLLTAATRVALTGTPVENRLSELWSIMDFTNPGLLGPFTRFTDRYAVPIERWRDADAAATLRRIVAPFMLRRLKTDPAVAPDLPPKIESTVACTLTREQATLYQATVKTLLDDEGLGEGITRQGRVLKLLTALKQICNHPAQYLGEPGPLRRRSGKLARATEILAELVAADERALIFTQYREMGELLAKHLSTALRLPKIPFLHGGVERIARDTMVETFQTGDQGAPLLIVSLKAGGTGLNLTRATHVLHYDRWWNPAVEDQATDRAYRIGQTKTVNVHKLVTAGTLEERIAAMLEEKRALADAVIGSGEAWLAELGDDDLRALVTLSTENIED